MPSIATSNPPIIQTGANTFSLFVFDDVVVTESWGASVLFALVIVHKEGDGAAVLVPSNTQLSNSARQELKKILIRETDLTTMEKLSDEDIDHFGWFLLTVHAEALKNRGNKTV